MTKRDIGFNHKDIDRSLRKIPGFYLYITEINSKHHSSLLLSLKFELILLLPILKRLKSFRWYFLMFAIKFIYWKVELLPHIKVKHTNKICSCAKRFSFDHLLTSLCDIFQLNHFPQPTGKRVYVN